MINSFVFPGNSGGPVLLKPETMSIQGTQNHPDPLLIGVVDAYQPYREPAVSLQTREARIVFEENSGLANILPIDYVNRRNSLAQLHRLRGHSKKGATSQYSVAAATGDRGWNGCSLRTPGRWSRRKAAIADHGGGTSQPGQFGPFAPYFEIDGWLNSPWCWSSHRVEA